LYQLGRCRLEAGDWGVAVTHLQRAVELNPQNSDAFYDLGKALLMGGRARDASAALNKAIALKPADPSPHYQLARALDKLGDKDGAKRERELFAELKKSQPAQAGMATSRDR
jgi:Flp pilus assembly protein TadD